MTHLSWAQDLKFHEHTGHITNEMLDKEYGEYGRSFKTNAEAQLFSLKHPGSIVTRLIDYYDSQLDCRGCKRPNAMPHTIGWQVTLPCSWENAQSSKVISFEKLKRRGVAW